MPRCKVFCRVFLFYFLCFSHHCIAISLVKNVSEICADDIDFNGKKMYLTGNVRLTHTFGSLWCDRATLFLAKEHMGDLKHSMPEKILLEDHVKVVMKDASVLTADYAEIYCETQEALFTAKAPNKVEYKTTVAEDEGKRVPIKTTAERIRLKLKKEKSEYVIEDLQGEGAVCIEYQNQEVVQ